MNDIFIQFEKDAYPNGVPYTCEYIAYMFLKNYIANIRYIYFATEFIHNTEVLTAYIHINYFCESDSAKKLVETLYNNEPFILHLKNDKWKIQKSYNSFTRTNYVQYFTNNYIANSIHINLQSDLLPENNENHEDVSDYVAQYPICVNGIRYSASRALNTIIKLRNNRNIETDDETFDLEYTLNLALYHLGEIDFISSKICG
jgi:hypothetical protein